MRSVEILSVLIKHQHIPTQRDGHESKVGQPLAFSYSRIRSLRVRVYNILYSQGIARPLGCKDQSCFGLGRLLFDLRNDSPSSNTKYRADLTVWPANSYALVILERF